jgi:hypothetical protein
MIEMKTPKVVGCLVCGFRSENVLEIESFQESGCPNCTKETNCGACGLFIETNEQDEKGFHLPQLCDANDETKEIRSLFIEGRLWFDKINGNTYFSNRVWVNGKIAFVMPFQYGYELQFLHSALNELKERGYTNTTTLWELRDEQKIDVYYSSTYGKKSEMFKVGN